MTHLITKYKDFDTFVVAVGLNDPQSHTHCFQELAVLWSFMLCERRGDPSSQLSDVSCSLDLRTVSVRRSHRHCNEQVPISR